MRGILVTAVLCLAAGIGVLFNWTHGTTGFQFASPVAGSSVHIDITTTGIPAIAGLALTSLGAFLLIVATLIALFTMRRSRVNTGPAKRRENVFEE